MRLLPLDVVLAVLLVAGTVSSFLPVLNASFLNYDDDDYVTENPIVNRGLSVAGIVRAFSSAHSANWHPITWVSHMVDCELFGLQARFHHRVNLALHCANVLLLYLAFARMTGARWRSFFVAAFFAVHPLHVQSVAWVSERKDLLCALFMLLSLNAYIDFVKNHRSRNYARVAFYYGCALLSKPMAVTFPFVLLLLDWWPLNRIDHAGGFRFFCRKFLSLLLEKLPLIAATLAVCVVTFLVQREAGAMADVTLPHRLASAVIAYGTYLGMTFSPVRLAVLYPQHAVITWQRPIAVLVVLLLVTVLAFRWRRRFPAAIGGWFWFLGTLVPVIGIVQVGMQSHADRYTYIPLIGLFFAVVWSGYQVVERFGSSLAQKGSVVVLVLILFWCGWRTNVEASYWSGPVSLYHRALAVTSGNFLILNNLGSWYYNENQYDSAEVCYRQSLEIAPRYEHANRNLGLVLENRGALDSAMVLFARAVASDSSYADGLHSLGDGYGARGQYDSAVVLLRRAVRFAPEQWGIRMSLAAAYLALSEVDSALACYERAHALVPTNQLPLRKQALILADRGEFARADSAAIAAAVLAPHDWRSYETIGTVLYRSSRLKGALAAYRQALLLNPRAGSVHAALAFTLAGLDSIAPAQEALSYALAADSTNGALLELKRILSEESQNREAGGG